MKRLFLKFVNAIVYNLHDLVYAIERRRGNTNPKKDTFTKLENWLWDCSCSLDRKVRKFDE